MQRLVFAVSLIALGAASACSSASSDASNAPPTGAPSTSRPDGGATENDGGGGGGGGGGSSTPPPDAAPVITYARQTISFDDVAEGTTILAQYAKWATFSSDPGCACSTTGSAGLAASSPSYLWTYYSCANGDAAAMNVAFTKPVRALRFKLVGVNGSGKVATARLLNRDGTKTTKDAIGKGDYATPVVVDLADATDITRLEIVDVNDAYGLGLDDLEFDFPE